MALLLARAATRVALYERRADPRAARPEAGRSINLALAARGMRAAGSGRHAAGRWPRCSCPCRGRQLHD